MSERFRHKLTSIPEPYVFFFLFIASAIVRVAYLGSIPGGYQMDEAYSAWNAFSLYHSGIDSSGHSWPVYFEAWGHGQNALNSYLMLPLIALWGGHVNLLIVRLPQVIISLATLAAVYAIMRKAFSITAARWALFLLGICPWHVTMSRWGLESNLAPGLLILGLCFFLYGLERPFFLPLSALFYGLSLYGYAVIWPIVPIILLLQSIYGIYHKKLTINKWSLCSIFIVLILGIPLFLFLLVNMNYLPEFQIGPFSVYKMTMFRGNEIAHSFDAIIHNIRNMLYLFYHQDVGRPYDVIMPHGFFYNVGRIFIIIGIVVLLYQITYSFLHRKFNASFFLFVQLIGGAIVGALVTVGMTQINCAYIPLVLCETIGVTAITSAARKIKQWLSPVIATLLIALYLNSFWNFEVIYYTDYKELVSAFFQEGSLEAVRAAFSYAKENSMDVYIDDALKYPNVLLYTETTAEEYLEKIIYSDSLPAPAQFTKDNVTFHMGVPDLPPQNNCVYIVYSGVEEKYSSFHLTQFYYWYLAVP